MHHFPDVPVHTDKATCSCCRFVFERGDRIVNVGIVAGIGPHPVTGRPVIYVSDDENSERAHADCNDKKKAGQKVIMANARSSGGALRARDSDTHCPSCTMQFQRGDRVVPTYIVTEIGVDEETGRPAASCLEDFEHVHFRCDDPRLNRGRVLIVA